MKTPKVRLYLRIRRSDGRDAFVEPVWNRNRTLRAAYGIVQGEAEHHPEGTYYLRYLCRGKRAWKSIGSNADAAIAAVRNLQHDLEALDLGRRSDQPMEYPWPSGRELPERRSLAEATQAYLDEVRQFRSPKTIAACENMLGRFLARYPAKVIDDITRKDLLDHMIALRGEGLGDRTVFNHITRINTLLKANGIPRLLRPADMPRYDEKEVRAYNADELATLFAAASAEERLLFHFFLGTGFRDGEVMHCTWRDVDFKGKVISARSKPEMGFKLKDHEERSVPVPDALVQSLADRKRRSTTMLIFPGKAGKAQGHFLRVLKRLAFRAGLNCGECVTKAGKGCGDHPVCTYWGLHSLRRTFATFHSDAGVSPRNIQKWLGHSDLATTLRYLAVAELRSERIRAQVNGTLPPLRSEAPRER